MNSGIAMNTSISKVGGGVGGVPHIAGVVGVSSGIGVMNGEAMSNLTDGVGISLSLTLAHIVPVVGGVDTRSGHRVDSRDTIASHGVNSRDSSYRVNSRDSSHRVNSRDSSHRMNSRGNHSMAGIGGGVAGVGDCSYIVRMTSGVGIVDGETMSDLPNGVGISIGLSLSLTLAEVVSSID